MDKYTGKRLDSRYEIQELIGVGGMAMVYKAYDSLDDKTVAIKILKDEFLGNDEFIRRFKNESKAIAVLSHPNIVKVYDVSFGDRIQYIVMEYIDGITLKEYIGQQKVIPWKEAVHFTVQILQALEHAHEKGIVHRDVKPQNIMLLQDGTIKVTDFGIARFSNKETRTMTDKAIGSVHYIAPEQARGGVTDGKADIYSVGVMLYEMLTGKLPFEADSAVSVAIMQLQNDPKPLREINSQIPGGLEEITLRAMRKDPKQRYASAGDMLEAIEIFRNDPAVQFNYRYFEDDTPTKYVESINTVKPQKQEPSYSDDYNNYDDELAVSRSKTAVKWITIIVALLVVAAIVVFTVMIVQNNDRQNAVKSVEVPNFVGQMIEDVKSNKNNKFNYEIIAKYDNTQPVNTVLSQDPEPNSKQIKENATIKLVVNSKSTKTEVPKVRNYLEQEAIDKLEAKFLGHDIQRVYSSEVAKGFVIDCSPQEGTEQEIGTPITLIISEGPSPEMIDVPNVVGSTYDKAKANLEALGFTTKKTNVASAKEAGQVIATDPLAGNQLPKGSLITIQVSDGSKVLRELSYDLGKDLPQNEYAEIAVKVILNETNGRNTILQEANGIPGEGMLLTFKLDPKGAVDNKKYVTVTVDNIKYESLTFDFKLQTVKMNEYVGKTKYKVKQSQRDPLLAKRDEVAEEIMSYPDYSQYSSSNGSQVRKIVEKYVTIEEKTDGTEERSGYVYDAESIDELKELLAYAKAEIDGVAKLTDPSRPEPSSEPDPSGNNTSSQPEPSEPTDSLANERKAAIEEITTFASLRFYTDENWAQVESILAEYTEKINNATSGAEIMSLNLEAQGVISTVPGLNDNSSGGA